MTVRRALLAVAVLVILPVTACGEDSNLPPTGGSFDYQLGGAYDGDFDIVARDSTAEPAKGAYSICYVNGFQTQPGAEWPEGLLLHDGGELVVDPEWPDEYVLDTGTNDNRRGILDVVGRSIDRCAASGFDAVEIDNLDVWTRFPGSVSEESTLDLAAMYAERAHDAGMAIAQKNVPDGAESIRNTVGFDFAVAEQCIEFDECAFYTDVYGDAVLDIEYAEEFCSASDRPAITILRDRGLTTPPDPSYVYRRC